jgi:hypothetical protein
MTKQKTESPPSFSLTRKYYQIYADFENIPFNADTKTMATLRAFLLENLAHFGLKEYHPNKKQSYSYFEDIVRLREPETEIKYGVGCPNNRFYIQMSCSEAKSFEAMFDYCIELLKEWCQK